MEETREKVKVWPRKDISRETYMTRVTSKRGAGRGYELEGAVATYPSVTHILSNTVVKHALPNWYAKKVADKAHELLVLSDTDFVTKPDIDGFVETIKSAPRDEFLRAGNIGTQAHDLINKAIRYKMDNPYTTWEEAGAAITDAIVSNKSKHIQPDDVANQVFRAFDNWLVFITANYPDILFLETEFATYIDGYAPDPIVPGGHLLNVPLYAGTVDAVGLTSDHKLVVFDWKTGSGIYDEAGYQVAAYCNSIWNGNPQLSHIYGGISGAVVRLSKTDDEFEVKTITDWEKPALVFKTMCSLYTQLSYSVFDKKARKKKVANA